LWSADLAVCESRRPAPPFENLTAGQTDYAIGEVARKAHLVGDAGRAAASAAKMPHRPAAPPVAPPCNLLSDATSGFEQEGTAMISPPAQQIPGIYHRKIGDIVVTAVSDGFLDGSLDVMRNVDLEAAHQLLRDAFRPARRTSVNAFLIYSSGRLAIVDTGSGNYLLPTAGFVQRNLAAAGIDPKSIDTVLLTHMHPDHSAGLTDMSNGARLFPNAELVMHENEPRHWFDDGAMAKADERSRKLYFMAGREQVAPYRDRTRLFTGGEVFPGVTAIPSLGHTPGHTAYLVASGDDQLMIWGDTVHVPEVQTAIPEAGMAFDTDLAAAAAARRRMFDRVAADRILIAGMHLHFPSFSRLARRGNAYQLHPEPWMHALEPS
jgi:glyoxylase-like metal-dependent hydrolase (beta-lactamase superfamily II)